MHTTNPNRTSVLVLTVILATLLAPSLGAQIGGGGTIQGVVSDPSGAPVPGATLTATNTATDVKTVRQTTSAGLYNLSPLPPGEYRVAVSATGFETLVQERVVVDALAVIGMNFVVKIGAVTEQVIVSATAETLKTDASMGETVRNEVWTALPLSMGVGTAKSPRDPTSFAALMPGVSGFNPANNNAGNLYGAQGSGSGSAGGVYLEGLPVTTILGGETRNIFLSVSSEAIEQFQLESAGSPVNFAGQGATNFVLKSGTNQFHGSAYEYLRNTDLDARGFFPAVRPVEHQNEFGFSVGGPIKKNRLFFFGNFDAYRFSAGSSPSFTTLPTLGERSGNFSAFPVATYDPQTTNCVAGSCTRQPFPGNVIPASRISPISQYFQQYLPNPDADKLNLLQNNYLSSVPLKYFNNDTSDKLDWNLDKSRLFGLFSRGHRANSTPFRTGATLPPPITNSRSNYIDEVPTLAQLSHTYVIGASMVNQAGLIFSRLAIPIRSSTMDGNYPTKAGIKGLPAGEASMAFPIITFAGPNPPNGWAAGSHSNDEIDTSYSFQDSFQWIAGKHAVTTGFQVAKLQHNTKADTYGSQATWAFSNTQTAGFNAAGTLQTTQGNAYASYLLGLVNTLSVTDDAVVGIGQRSSQYAWWIQDAFKITPRLTFTIGLRHDIFTPLVEVHNVSSFLDPNLANPAVSGRPGALTFAGNGTAGCNCRTPVSTHFGNLGPRASFAYNINSRTVIRGGYMAIYSRGGDTGGTRAGTGLLGFVANPSWTSLDGGVSPGIVWDNGVPAYTKAPFYDPTLNTGFNTKTAQGGTIGYGDAQIGGRSPRYQDWDFGLQRLVGPWTLGLHYVGSNGHFLGGGSRGIFSNQILPKYAALGNLLTASATAANVAAAQAVFPDVKLPYANYAGTISQMLRAFPQYSTVTDAFGNVGDSSYNSLQVTARKALSHGLITNFNYVFNKGFDDLTSRSGYWTERAQSTLPSHTVNLTLVYRVPLGKGQRFLANNAVVTKVVSNWQLSGITTYRSGASLGSIAASCNLPSMGSCYANLNPTYSGDIRINGNYGDGNLLGSSPTAYLASGAFASPAAFTYGNTSRNMGIRGPSSYNQDLTLRREFPIHESLRMSVQLDAFNAFNLVNFSNPAVNITSTTFGRISSQSNNPRAMQVAARIMF